MLSKFLSEMAWGITLVVVVLAIMLYLKLLVDSLKDEIEEKMKEETITNEVGHGGVVS
jgi:hypothetical protein